MVYDYDSPMTWWTICKQLGFRDCCLFVQSHEYPIQERYSPSVNSQYMTIRHYRNLSKVAPTSSVSRAYFHISRTTLPFTATCRSDTRGARRQKIDLSSIRSPPPLRSRDAELSAVQKGDPKFKSNDLDRPIRAGVTFLSLHSISPTPSDSLVPRDGVHLLLLLHFD